MSDFEPAHRVYVTVDVLAQNPDGSFGVALEYTPGLKIRTVCALLLAAAESLGQGYKLVPAEDQQCDDCPCGCRPSDHAGGEPHA